jgi:hypothetical protein
MSPVHMLAKLVKGTDVLRHLAPFRNRPTTLVHMPSVGEGGTKPLSHGLG